MTAVMAFEDGGTSCGITQKRVAQIVQGITRMNIMKTMLQDISRTREEESESDRRGAFLLRMFDNPSSMFKIMYECFSRINFGRHL